MNKTLLVAVAVVGIIVLGGLAFAQMNRPSTPADSLMKKEDAAVGEKTPEATMEKAGIEIKGFKHSPSVVTVKAGSTVTVKNLDLAGHSVTSDTPGLFDTGVIAQNQTATFTAPSQSGTYGYHCTPHPSMQATLIVE